MVIKYHHIKLPEGTLCPNGKGRVLSKQCRPRLSIISRRTYIHCNGCRKDHYITSFKKTLSPQIYDDLEQQVKEIRNSFNSESQMQPLEDQQSTEKESQIQSIDLTEESNAESILESILDYELNSNPSGNNIIIKTTQQQIIEQGQKYNELCDKIADDFQKSVSESKDYYTDGKKKDFCNTYRIQVWNHYNKLPEVVCPCCRITIISNNNFQVGHIHPESKMGRNTIDNLLPVCQTCNNSMGRKHMYTFAWQTYQIPLWKFQRFG